MGHVCEAGAPHCFTAVSHFDEWITENTGVPSASESNSTENSTAPSKSKSGAEEGKLGTILDLLKKFFATIASRK